MTNIKVKGKMILTSKTEVQKSRFLLSFKNLPEGLKSIGRFKRV